MNPIDVIENQIEKRNGISSLRIGNDIDVQVYPNSINKYEDLLFFIGKQNYTKNLIIISEKKSDIFENFDGEITANKDLFIKKSLLNNKNSKLIQSLFPFTKPSLIGLEDSFGYGDRTGVANPGHARVALQYKFKSIFAQQSIRELTRTKRSPEEVMDAAVWAVFQEGYKNGYGADADHLKTTEQADMMLKAGYTFLTIDSGEFVDNSADSLNENELQEKASSINFSYVNATVEEIINRYNNKTFNLGDGITLSPGLKEILIAVVKYGRCFAHIKNLTSFAAERHSDKKYEVEISIDETNTHTTPFDHFFIANELKHAGIKFMSVAPHFIGGFEKGIDYKKDLKMFTENFKVHSTIAKYFGTYKISFHSGSDKFSIYKIVGEMKDRSPVHIKTAGTSYLVALNVIALKNPDLFRRILQYSLNEYDKEKASYHVTAEVSHLKKSEEYKADELPALFENESARQILHVAFGKVLSEKENSRYLFKDEILDTLNRNEELHYKLLDEHFRKHLEPFK